MGAWASVTERRPKAKSVVDGSGLDLDAKLDALREAGLQARKDTKKRGRAWIKRLQIAASQAASSAGEVGMAIMNARMHDEDWDAATRKEVAELDAELKEIVDGLNLEMSLLHALFKQFSKITKAEAAKKP